KMPNSAPFINEVLEKLKYDTSTESKEPLQILNSGDVIFRQPGKETFLGNDGTSVTVHAGGKITVEAKEPITVESKPNGDTLVSFKNNDKLLISNGRFSSIERDGVEEPINKRHSWDELSKFFQNYRYRFDLNQQLTELVYKKNQAADNAINSWIKYDLGSGGGCTGQTELTGDRYRPQYRSVPDTRMTPGTVNYDTETKWRTK